MPTAQVLHEFLDLSAFHIFHQPTRLASRMAYAIAFHPPPLEGRLTDIMLFRRLLLNPPRRFMVAVEKRSRKSHVRRDINLHSGIDRGDHRLQADSPTRRLAPARLARHPKRCRQIKFFVS
jgi:hypothetical protein